MKTQALKLGRLTGPGYGDSGAQAIYNNTWGHYAPKKNTSYKGIIRFVLTDHSQYGSQPIITEYDFLNLEGPYIHDVLFRAVCDWDKENLENGAVYEIKVTFRNYCFYYGKINKVLKPITRPTMKTIFETGTNSHAVNELILFTDNTRNLAELRDHIYTQHKNKKQRVIPQFNLTPLQYDLLNILFYKASNQYVKKIPDNAEMIQEMSVKEQQEYVDIYAARINQ